MSQLPREFVQWSVVGGGDGGDFRPTPRHHRDSMEGSDDCFRQGSFQIVSPDELPVVCLSFLFVRPSAWFTQFLSFLGTLGRMTDSTTSLELHFQSPRSAAADLKDTR